MTEPLDPGKGAGRPVGPPPRASIEVTLRSGDTIVRRFYRGCPEDTDLIRRMAEDATGWLQAWSCQLSIEQWHKDAQAQRQGAAA